MRVIHVARKPVEGSVAKNALKHGTGGINIDGSRVKSSQMPSSTTAPGWASLNARNAREGYRGSAYRQDEATYNPSTLGRWPANVILQHRPECYLAGTVKNKPYNIQRYTDGAKVFGGGEGHPYETVETGPDVTDVWVCIEGCPVKGLDDQSGVSTSPPKGSVANVKASNSFGTFATKDRTCPNGHGDTGGASRFFKQVQAEPVFIRASGDCLCPDCNKPYRKHPYDMKMIGWNQEPWLHVLCDGTRVKL